MYYINLCSRLLSRTQPRSIPQTHENGPSETLLNTVRQHFYAELSFLALCIAKEGKNQAFKVILTSSLYVCLLVIFQKRQL